MEGDSNQQTGANQMRIFLMLLVMTTSATALAARTSKDLDTLNAFFATYNNVSNYQSAVLGTKSPNEQINALTAYLTGSGCVLSNLNDALKTAPAGQVDIPVVSGTGCFILANYSGTRKIAKTVISDKAIVQSQIQNGKSPDANSLMLASLYLDGTSTTTLDKTGQIASIIRKSTDNYMTFAGVQVGGFTNYTAKVAKGVWTIVKTGKYYFTTFGPNGKSTVYNYAVTLTYTNEITKHVVKVNNILMTDDEIAQYGVDLMSLLQPLM
jgi:hypothetical protein